jgi:hypothetical protein
MEALKNDQKIFLCNSILTMRRSRELTNVCLSSDRREIFGGFDQELVLRGVLDALNVPEGYVIRFAGADED